MPADNNDDDIYSGIDNVFSNNDPYTVGTHSAKNELDFYEDFLIQEEKEKVNKVFQELQKKIKELQGELNLQTKKSADLEHDNTVIQKNMFALWKTAKTQERQLKTEVAAVKKARDEIIFKRHITNAPKDEIDKIISRISAYDVNEKSLLFKSLASDVKNCLQKPKLLKKKTGKFNAEERTMGCRINPDVHSDGEKIKKFLKDKGKSITKAVKQGCPSISVKPQDFSSGAISSESNLTFKNKYDFVCTESNKNSVYKNSNYLEVDCSKTIGKTDFIMTMTDSKSNTNCADLSSSCSSNNKSVNQIEKTDSMQGRIYNDENRKDKICDHSEVVGIVCRKTSSSIPSFVVPHTQCEPLLVSSLFELNLSKCNKSSAKETVEVHGNSKEIITHPSLVFQKDTAVEISQETKNIAEGGVYSLDKVTIDEKTVLQRSEKHENKSSKHIKDVTTDTAFHGVSSISDKQKIDKGDKKYKTRSPKQVKNINSISDTKNNHYSESSTKNYSFSPLLELEKLMNPKHKDEGENKSLKYSRESYIDKRDIKSHLSYNSRTSFSPEKLKYMSRRRRVVSPTKKKKSWIFSPYKKYSYNSQSSKITSCLSTRVSSTSRDYKRTYKSRSSYRNNTNETFDLSPKNVYISDKKCNLRKLVIKENGPSEKTNSTKFEDCDGSRKIKHKDNCENNKRIFEEKHMLRDTTLDKLNMLRDATLDELNRLSSSEACKKYTKSPENKKFKKRNETDNKMWHKASNCPTEKHEKNTKLRNNLGKDLENNKSRIALVKECTKKIELEENICKSDHSFLHDLKKENSYNGKNSYKNNKVHEMNKKSDVIGSKETSVPFEILSKKKETCIPKQVSESQCISSNIADIVSKVEKKDKLLCEVEDGEIISDDSCSPVKYVKNKSVNSFTSKGTRSKLVHSKKVWFDDAATFDPQDLFNPLPTVCGKDNNSENVDDTIDTIIKKNNEFTFSSFVSSNDSEHSLLTYIDKKCDSSNTNITSESCATQVREFDDSTLTNTVNTSEQQVVNNTLFDKCVSNSENYKENIDNVSNVHSSIVLDCNLQADHSHLDNDSPQYHLKSATSDTDSSSSDESSSSSCSTCESTSDLSRNDTLQSTTVLLNEEKSCEGKIKDIQEHLSNTIDNSKPATLYHSLVDKNIALEQNVNVCSNNNVTSSSTPISSSAKLRFESVISEELTPIQDSTNGKNISFSQNEENNMSNEEVVKSFEDSPVKIIKVKKSAGLKEKKLSLASVEILSFDSVSKANKNVYTNRTFCDEDKIENVVEKARVSFESIVYAGDLIKDCLSEKHDKADNSLNNNIYLDDCNKQCDPKETSDTNSSSSDVSSSSYSSTCESTSDMSVNDTSQNTNVLLNEDKDCENKIKEMHEVSSKNVENCKLATGDKCIKEKNNLEENFTVYKNNNVASLSMPAFSKELNFMQNHNNKENISSSTEATNMCNKNAKFCEENPIKVIKVKRTASLKGKNSLSLASTKMFSLDYSGSAEERSYKPTHCNDNKNENSVKNSRESFESVVHGVDVNKDCKNEKKGESDNIKMHLEDVNIHLDLKISSDSSSCDDSSSSSCLTWESTNVLLNREKDCKSKIEEMNDCASKNNENSKLATIYQCLKEKNNLKKNGNVNNNSNVASISTPLISSTQETFENVISKELTAVQISYNKENYLPNIEVNNLSNEKIEKSFEDNSLEVIQVRRTANPKENKSLASTKMCPLDCTSRADEKTNKRTHSNDDNNENIVKKPRISFENVEDSTPEQCVNILEQYTKHGAFSGKFVNSLERSEGEIIVNNKDTHSDIELDCNLQADHLHLQNDSQQSPIKSASSDASSSSCDESASSSCSTCASISDLSRNDTLQSTNVLLNEKECEKKTKEVQEHLIEHNKSPTIYQCFMDKNNSLEKNILVCKNKDAVSSCTVGSFTEEKFENVIYKKPTPLSKPYNDENSFTGIEVSKLSNKEVVKPFEEEKTVKVIKIRRVASLIEKNKLSLSSTEKFSLNSVSTADKKVSIKKKYCDNGKSKSIEKKPRVSIESVVYSGDVNKNCGNEKQEQVDSVNNKSFSNFDSTNLCAASNPAITVKRKVRLVQPVNLSCSSTMSYLTR